MASAAASMTNMMLRFAERGDGGFGGSLNSRPLVIDLANSRLRSGFICRGGQLDIIANFEPARSYIGVMVTGRLQKGHFGSNRHCSMLR